MKSLNQNHNAEKNAQRLSGLSSISPDKRHLLREIVNSAPQNLTQNSQLNTYFATTAQQSGHETASKQPMLRIYAGMAVVAVLLLGSGIFWFGWQNRSLNTPSQSSQISANGKVANAVNTITQQAETELQTVQTANIDATNLDTINTQLGQMQEVVK